MLWLNLPSKGKQGGIFSIGAKHEWFVEYFVRSPPCATSRGTMEYGTT